MSTWCQCEVSFKNCTFYSLALKDVYIKHFYDLLAFYWHLADCRSIVVLAPITHFALLSAQYKSQNLIKQFIKSNLCQLMSIRELFRKQKYALLKATKINKNQESVILKTIYDN